MRILLPTLVLSLLTSYFLLLTYPRVSAQDYSAGFPEVPTCDLCGGCTTAEGVFSKPTDWQRCCQCIYGSENCQGVPDSEKSWTPIGCIDSEVGQPGEFIQQVLRFIISIAGGLAFLGFIWGGFQLLTAAGDPIRIASGKNTILAASGALLLILFAVLLLYFIGFAILGIPGFGG